MSPIEFIPECLTGSQPLPKFQDSVLTQSNNKSIADIYACVLAAEAVAWNNIIHAHAQDEAPCALTGPALVNVRLVGWLLIALFERKALLGDTPMINVAEDVRRALCKDGDRGIERRGGQYRRIIRNTWKWRCEDALSKPSDYHHTFLDYKEWLDDSSEVEERTGVWDESKVADFEALTRDGFACLVIPEAYSDQYIRANPGRFRHGEYACRLESARIIPRLRDCSFDGDACPSAEKAHNTVPMTVLDLFGLSEFVTTILAPAGVDHLSNILSLSFALRGSFERLRMWFDVVGKPDQYRIKCADVFRDRRIPHDPLTFRNRAETVNLESRLDNYPLPDARLLAIHAACASAMNISGDIRYELVRKSEMESNPTFTTWLEDALTDLEVDQW